MNWTKKNFNKNLFKLNLIFNKNTKLSQKCVFENIVYVLWRLTKSILRKFLFFNGFSSISQWVFNISKKNSVLKFPFNATWPVIHSKYKAYDDCIWKNRTKRRKVKMRNFLLNYYSDQIIIYIDCNRIEGSFFKIRIQAL